VGGTPGLGPDHVGGRSKTEEPDPMNLARGLSGGGTGHREGPEGEAAMIRSAPGNSLLWDSTGSLARGYWRAIGIKPPARMVTNSGTHGVAP
jgi:hypothetical protein